ACRGPRSGRRPRPPRRHRRTPREGRRMSDNMQRLLRHTDLIAAVAVVLIVVMMIVPLPPAIIDLFITLNISTAIVIVVAPLYVPRALDFAAFPALLLLTTLFRLAINISVTR